MDYLKTLRDDPDLAEKFDALFDFFLLDELSPKSNTAPASVSVYFP